MSLLRRLLTLAFVAFCALALSGCFSTVTSIAQDAGALPDSPYFHGEGNLLYFKGKPSPNTTRALLERSLPKTAPPAMLSEIEPTRVTLASNTIKYDPQGFLVSLDAQFWDQDLVIYVHTIAAANTQISGIAIEADDVIHRTTRTFKNKPGQHKNVVQAAFLVTPQQMDHIANAKTLRVYVTFAAFGEYHFNASGTPLDNLRAFWKLARRDLTPASEALVRTDAPYDVKKNREDFAYGIDGITRLHTHAQKPGLWNHVLQANSQHVRTKVRACTVNAKTHKLRFDIALPWAPDAIFKRVTFQHGKTKYTAKKPGNKRKHKMLHNHGRAGATLKPRNLQPMLDAPFWLLKIETSEGTFTQRIQGEDLEPPKAFIKLAQETAPANAKEPTATR